MYQENCNDKEIKIRIEYNGAGGISGFGETPPIIMHQGKTIEAEEYKTSTLP